MPGYAVLDTETTGFSPATGDRVLEVAVVLLDSAARFEGEWETLLNPGRGVGPEHIHGITPAIIEHAPGFADVAAYLANLLAGRLVVGHNVAFDARFLHAEFEAVGMAVPLQANRCLCTQALARDLLPGPKRTLAACCEQAGVDHTNAHSALGDTRATAELLRYFVRHSPVPAPWRALHDAAVRARWPVVGRSAAAPPAAWLGGGQAEGMLDLASVMPAQAPAPVRVLTR